MTTGKGWGEMAKVDLEKDIALKNDVKAVKLRNAIYSNRFYKSNDSKELPKYF